MKEQTKSILRNVFYPLVLVKREIYYRWIQYLGSYNPKKLASILHYDYCKREIDWDYPKDLNEKINWLKFNSDTTMWSKLSDKYAVRKYIEDAGFGDMLVKLYGVWSSADEIDFIKLPQSFVLKTNNGSGTVLIVKDKNMIDEKEVRSTLKKWLKLKFGVMTAEPHYFPIKPLIIAEELLVNDKIEISSSLIDYKIWCFGGKPYVVWTCSDRIVGRGASLTYYDINWNKQSENLLIVKNYLSAENDIPMPSSFPQMLDACRKLTKEFPQVRVDFYEVNNKPYFGEFTFTSEAGYMDVCTHDYLIEMGNQFQIQ